MVFRGRVRDIQPNQVQPTLELYFEAKNRSALPKGTHAEIILDLNGKRWHGTINSIGQNQPYVHTRLRQSFGDTSTCTQVFQELGLVEGAIIDFECKQGNILHLKEIIDPGRWRAGNEPGRRTKGARTASNHPQSVSMSRERFFNFSGKTIMEETDIKRLGAALRRDFPKPRTSSNRAWSRAPALRVIDCVLSLNRRYDGFVVPRLDRFEGLYPKVTTVRSLRTLIEKFPTPADFVHKALDYRHPQRGRILLAVVNFAMDIIGYVPENSETAQLEQLAKRVNPIDHRALNIPGFGLAGFQYLRMLFGANTTKPDVHIRGYVADVLGRPISEIEALRLLEAASDRYEFILRDLDTNIWETKHGHAGEEIWAKPIHQFIPLPFDSE